MNSIAILGPMNTFSDLAAQKYMDVMGIAMNSVYYSTIIKTYNAISSECDFGIIPIENTIDGYVQVTLDLLEKGEMKIIHEIVLPIEFVFISKFKRIEDMSRLFVQFKTHNQCLNFIESLGEVDVITTASNGVSYRAFIEDDTCDAVIIPKHLLDQNDIYNCRIDHVADYIDNETRFVILSHKLNEEDKQQFQWRTSFVVCDDKDRPGLLSDILNVFSKRDINLKSIISRPQKNGLGNYNFFIDIEGCYMKNDIVKEAVKEIMKNYSIKILGSYYKLEDSDKS